MKNILPGPNSLYDRTLPADPCPACEGKGQVLVTDGFHGAMRPCKHCGGSGKQLLQDSLCGPYTRPCPACNGKGCVEDDIHGGLQSCYQCGGSGKAPPFQLAYLAVCYTHADPAVMEARYRAVTYVAGCLFKRGQPVFSPITHSHPIKVAAGLGGLYADYRAYDQYMIKNACNAVLVLMLEGWLPVPPYIPADFPVNQFWSKVLPCT